MALNGKAVCRWCKPELETYVKVIEGGNMARTLCQTAARGNELMMADIKRYDAFQLFCTPRRAAP